MPRGKLHHWRSRPREHCSGRFPLVLRRWLRLMGEESDLTHLRKFIGGQIHRRAIGQVRGLGCTQAFLDAADRPRMRHYNTVKPSGGGEPESRGCGQREVPELHGVIRRVRPQGNPLRGREMPFGAPFGVDVCSFCQLSGERGLSSVSEVLK